MLVLVLLRIFFFFFFCRRLTRRCFPSSFCQSRRRPGGGGGLLFRLRRRSSFRRHRVVVVVQLHQKQNDDDVFLWRQRRGPCSITKRHLLLLETDWRAIVNGFQSATFVSMYRCEFYNDLKPIRFVSFFVFQKNPKFQYPKRYTERHDFKKRRQKRLSKDGSDQKRYKEDTRNTCGV